jgi:hypothetical protein
MIVFRKASRFAQKNLDFRLEIFFWFSFKNKSKEKSVLSFLAKTSLVMVLQLFKVMTDGFAEFDCPFQYFTKAILLGAVRNSPLSML